MGQNDLLVITSGQAQQIASYLALRPWREVHTFMEIMRTLEPIEAHEKAEEASVPAPSAPASEEPPHLLQKSPHNDL